MNEYFERLTNYLLEKNDSLAYAQARTWVELLWEDFETTYARAGYSYKGKEMTEKVVRQWIDPVWGASARVSDDESKI